MSDQQVSQTTTSQREPGLEQRLFTFKATYVIWLLLVILEGLLALRIGLKLIGANPDSPFAALIYGFTNLFLLPFAGLIGTPSAGGMVLEISSVIAMAVYALVGWALERLVWVIFYRPREVAVAVTQQTSSERHTP
jgi:YGGT family protein